MAKKIFISTGEVSGDLQGGLLVEALRSQARDSGISLTISAVGGERMAAGGADLLENTSDIGSVGLLESLPFVLPAWQLQRRIRKYLQENPPDLVILIDYMGPNLSLGAYLKAKFPQIPVVYYIAPQAWVWSLSDRNTQEIARISDRLFAIFPEEARFFEQQGVSVTWVGHPLVDLLQNAPSRQQAREKLEIDGDTIAIALLPASRHQELKYLMPVIFEAARQLQERIPQVRFWIPLSLETYRESIETAIEDYGLHATLTSDRTQEVLSAADLAIAKSGTVNLELALLDVPQVVLYRVHPVTAWIARKLLGFEIPFMSPPNLVQMKSIVPELLQEEATAENIVAESLELLLNRDRRSQIQSDYQQMRQTIGEVGACDRAAREMLQFLTEAKISCI